MYLIPGVRMSADRLATLISGAGLIINTIAIVFVIYQVKLLRQQVEHAKDVFEREQRRVQRQSTLEFVGTTMQRLAELADRMPSPFDVAGTAAFIEDTRSNAEARKLFISYFNYYEGLAAGANCGIYDIEVIYRVRGTTIIRLEELYRDFVKQLRDETRHPEKYREVEILAVSLRQWEVTSGRESSSVASREIPDAQSEQPSA
jgi:hypothetical protein